MILCMCLEATIFLLVNYNSSHIFIIILHKAHIIIWHGRVQFDKNLHGSRGG
jgi:hypothetical protein